MKALAGITFKEGVRDRALYGIFIFSFSVMILGLAVLSFFGQNMDKVASDFMLSALTFAGLLISFFISPQLVAKDLERKTIYVLLAKPISRFDYILGKYAGILLLITVATVILAFFAMVGMFLANFFYSSFFQNFRVDAFLLAILGEWLVFALINAIVIFFASFSSSGFLTLLFSVSIYIVGENIETVYRYLQTATEAVPLSSPVLLIIEISRYVFPNMALFDLKAQAAHGILVPFSYVVSISAYAASYIAILLFMASFFFKRRELA
ncbi:ABC transporter permease subunit [Desulfobotulus sp. H1]|uniref:ABC transporter permease subunit n=1 Tax=Desulfobotulus pelophilus TaxID=2823377 RepID=A0ABT3N9P9_9BACT|nr:ABC transporter permease subunit [Desulfobotulus pelophilus]MCW7754190.1 ABC transporter permease subunit [Desulfobotulus pelophilus]